MGRNSAIPGLIVLVCGILGFLVAIVEKVAYDNEWILNQYITEAEMLPGLQILTIVIWLLAGGVLAALSQ